MRNKKCVGLPSLRNALPICPMPVVLTSIARKHTMHATKRQFGAHRDDCVPVTHEDALRRLWPADVNMLRHAYLAYVRSCHLKYVSIPARVEPTCVLAYNDHPTTRAHANPFSQLKHQVFLGCSRFKAFRFTAVLAAQLFHMRAHERSGTIKIILVDCHRSRCMLGIPCFNQLISP
jgi:hypothetical protein